MITLKIKQHPIVKWKGRRRIELIITPDKLEIVYHRHFRPLTKRVIIQRNKIETVNVIPSVWGWLFNYSTVSIDTGEDLITIPYIKESSIESLTKL